jgi:hypothetical protein
MKVDDESRAGLHVATYLDERPAGLCDPIIVDLDLTRRQTRGNGYLLDLGSFGFYELEGDGDSAQRQVGGQRYDEAAVGDDEVTEITGPQTGVNSRPEVRAGNWNADPHFPWSRFEIDELDHRFRTDGSQSWTTRSTSVSPSSKEPALIERTSVRKDMTFDQHIGGVL